MRRATLANFAAETYPLPRIIGAGSAGAVETTFIYRPGALNPLPPVYNDWPTLMAAVATVPGPKTIQIDDSIITPAVIPSSASAPGGVWDLHDCVLVGTLTNPLASNPPVQARCAIGCVFANFAEISGHIQLTSVSTRSVYTLLDGSVVLLRDAAIVDSTTHPFFDGPGPYTSTPFIILELGCNLGTTPGQFVISIEDVPNGVSVLLEGPLCFVPDNIATGPGTLGFLFASAEVFATWSGTLPPSQPSVTTFDVFDATTPRDLQHYWCNATNLANPGPAGPWSIPFGYSLLSVNTTVPVEFVPLESGLITRMIVHCDGTNNPLDAGTSLTYQLTLNGVPVPGASVMIPHADTGGSGFAGFLAGYNLSGEPRIDLVLTPSAPLNSPVQHIIATLS